MSKPRHRSTSLRQAFVSTATTAVVAATVASGCGTIFTNPPYLDPCPEASPASGSTCNDEGLGCGYIDECGNPIEYTCGSGTWAISEVTSCNPPPPDECPGSQPAWGEPCDAIGLTCSFGLDHCGQLITGECTLDGWIIDEIFSCNPPPAECPDELPVEGSPCTYQPDTIDDYPSFCGYAVETPCGTQTVEASCVDVEGAVVWQFDSPPTCEAEPEQCQTYDGPGACEADPGCAWRTPGCAGGEGAPSLDTAGCFPIEDCATTVDACGAWGTCTLVTHNPCWNSECDACGGEISVCIPN